MLYMYVGVDHSTTAVNVIIIDDKRTLASFRIPRLTHSEKEEKSPNILPELRARINIDEIDLAAISYCYGDGIYKVSPISQVQNRGVIDCNGMGYTSGIGTKAFDQMQGSSIPTVVVPGVHRRLQTLHPYFRHYSLLSGGDKVGSMRAAFERFKKFSNGEGGTWIWAGAGSSVMSGMITNGEIRGVFHWIGPVHGWPDLEEIRAVDEKGVKDIFTRSGFLGKLRGDQSPINHTEKLAKMIIWSLKHDISSLLPFVEEPKNEIEAIVLTGRQFHEGSHKPNISREIYEWAIEYAPVLFTPPYASARGLAYIARDVMRERQNIMGFDASPSVKFASELN